MNFEKLRFEAAKLNMELLLKFPVTKNGDMQVGRHKWQVEGVSFQENVKAYQWIFRHDDPYRAAFKIAQAPDLWRKVNGGWQIVY